MKDDNKIQARFTNKQQLLIRECRYGFTHFCDGTPNISVDSRSKKISHCPDYCRCKIRKQSIYDER